jgi:hypothetical protein
VTIGVIVLWLKWIAIARLSYADTVAKSFRCIGATKNFNR